MADERSSEGELERTVVPNPEVVEPPRVESATEGRVDFAVGQDSEAPSTVRRRVGRPRKHPPKVKASGSQAPNIGGQSTSQHSDTANEGSQAESSRPKRGRPRKNPPAPMATESASNEPRRIPSPNRVMTRQRTRATATSNDEDFRQPAQTSRTRRPR